MRVSHLGPSGTFGEEAAASYQADAEFVPYASHQQVVESVLQGESDIGVVARENSIGGPVNEVIELLVQSSVGSVVNGKDGNIAIQPGKIMVCGEVYLPIVQCLYLRPGVSLEQVETVYSHSQGFAQCGRFLQEMLPNARLVPQLSTVAGIAEMLKSELPGAAIAPRTAERYFAADLVEIGIQDNDSNATRFLVVGRDDCLRSGRDKTSIVFRVPEEERAGSFDRVSQLFATCGVNKTLIESKAAQTQIGRYVFLMDVEGHREDPVIRRILELCTVAELTTLLKVLGSYPKAQ